MVRVLPRDAVTTITQLLPKLDAPHFAPSKEIADRIAAILEVVDQVPDELLVLDSAQYTAFVANRAALRQLLAEWTGGTSSRALAPIKGFSQNPIVVIRDALAACPNEVILPGTAELPFLENDPELQASLRLDLSHAERALVNGEWKAATVLAGSVLEALLLWALAQHASAAAAATKAPKKPLDEWPLPDCIEVAVELGLLFTPDTITEAKLAKNYRNLIHPGRVQRLNQPCDKGTAQVAAAAVSHVVRDLAVKFP